MSEETWLDSWTAVRRLPNTFKAAQRFATRQGHAADYLDNPNPTPRPLPIEDTKFILQHGKKAWRDRQNGLRYTVEGYPIVPVMKHVRHR